MKRATQAELKFLRRELARHRALLRWLYINAGFSTWQRRVTIQKHNRLARLRERRFKKGGRR